MNASDTPTVKVAPLDLSADTAARRYLRAINADTHYTMTIEDYAGKGKTRWNLTSEENQIPEIRAAYLEKVAADDAWLASWECVNMLLPPEHKGPRE